MKFLLQGEKFLLSHLQNGPKSDMGVYANPPKNTEDEWLILPIWLVLQRMFGGMDSTGKPLNTCEWYNVAKTDMDILP